LNAGTAFCGNGCVVEGGIARKHIAAFLIAPERKRQQRK